MYLASYSGVPVGADPSPAASLVLVVVGNVE